MRIFPYKTWVSVVALALVPCMSQAAGLGKLTILSALGEPLNAEVELLSVTKEELATLSAKLASPDAFQQAKVPYSPALVGLRVSIDKRPDGQPYVKMVSTRAVNEPFIDFLVELNWASGRLLREYTGLVDPPGYGKAPEPVAPIVVIPPTVAQAEAQPVAPAPQPAAPTTSSAVPAAPRVAATEPRPTATVEPRPTATARPSTPPAAPRGQPKQYGPIKRGETLTSIASGIKPESVTLEQMLVSLYRHNSDAFDGNMNRMKTGKILRVPEAEEVTETAAPAATKEVRVQAADWNSYRQKLADAATSTPARETAAAASGKITTTVEDKGVTKAQPKEVVRISKGEPPASSAAGKGASSADRIRALEEEAVARQKALQDANERIAQLEKTIKDMQRLVELKGQVPAAKPPAPKSEPAPPPKAETVAKAEPPKAEPAKAEPPKPAPKAEPAKAEPAKAPAPVAAAPEPAKVEAKAVTPEPAKAEAPKAEVAKAEPKPKPRVVPPPPPPPPSLADQIMEEPLYLAGGGIGIAALGGLGYWFVRRRRTEGGEAAAPAAKAGKAAAAAAGGAQPPAAVPVVGPVDDVDALQEADLYLSFGRDAQAEAVLKDELQKNPTREDVQLKLLEVYAARKDKAQFEAVARALNTQTAGVGDNWVKAAAMGFAFDPENALYEAGKLVPPITPASLTGVVTSGSDLDFDLDLSAPSTAAKTDLVLEPGIADATAVTDVGVATAAATESTLMLAPGELIQTVEAVTADSAAPHIAAAPAVPDFTLSAPAELRTSKPDILLEVPQEPSAEEAALKPDIVLEAQPHEPAKAEVDVAAVAAGAGNLIDFNFELPEQTSDRFKRESVETTPPEETSVPALDFDLGEKPGEAPPQAAAPEVAPAVVAEANVADAAAVTAPPVEPELKLDLDGVKTGIKDWLADTPPPVSEPAPAVQEAPAPPEAEAEPDIPDIKLDHIDLSFDEAPKSEVPKSEAPKQEEAAKDDRWYDVQTKFDLAKAYQEMGDKEGAREILEEVMKEGDAGQQVEAKQMLAALA